jgi:hypothetical protein
VYTDFKNQFFTGLRGLERGNPAATPAAIFAVVDAAQPPLRLFLGSHNLPAVRTAYAERLATWEAWAPVSTAAQSTTR